MPAKFIKNKNTGRVYEIKSILLPNGNLLVPMIIRRTPKKFVGWVEVEPSDRNFFRWYPVHVTDHDDPRLTKAYRTHVQNVAPDLVDQIMTLKGKMSGK